MKFTANEAIGLLRTEGTDDGRYALDDVLAMPEDVNDLAAWLIKCATEHADRHGEAVDLRALTLAGIDAGVRLAEKVYEVQR